MTSTSTSTFLSARTHSPALGLKKENNTEFTAARLEKKDRKRWDSAVQLRLTTEGSSGSQQIG